MYLIREDRTEDLKDGRTTRDISELVEVTEGYLSQIFSGKRQCSTSLAMVLVSLRKQVPINRDSKKLLDDYFTREEE